MAANRDSAQGLAPADRSTSALHIKRGHADRITFHEETGHAIRFARSAIRSWKLRFIFAWLSTLLEEVWLLVFDWASLNIRQPTADEHDVKTWWEDNLRHLTLNKQRSVAAVLMITTWCLWTERNRRLFEHRSLTPIQVFSLVKAELLLLLEN
jgi:hypothetical protein